VILFKAKFGEMWQDIADYWSIFGAKTRKVALEKQVRFTINFKT
jgi:hypothetical protein